MKKAVAVLLLFLSVFICSACKKNEDDSNSISQKITETVAGIISTTQGKKVVTILHLQTGISKEMSADGSEFIITLLENNPWDDGATADCLNDFSFTVNGKIYYYHSDCGTFNDNDAIRSLTVNDSEKERLQKIVDDIYNSEKPTAVRDDCYPEEKCTAYKGGDSIDADFESIISNYSAADDDHHYSAEKDGILLEVDTTMLAMPSTEFCVVAKVTNTTNKDIEFSVPYGAGEHGTHKEIKVVITDGENEFTDTDVYRKEFLDAAGQFTLKSGETYTQVMNFIPGKIISDSNGKPDAFLENYRGGNFTGTATFTWYLTEYGRQKKSVSLEFPVVLASKSSTFQPVNP